MASRIQLKEPVQYGKTTKRVKKPDYLDWVRKLPCMVTGRTGVEAAHVSAESRPDGHEGRGKGRKASDRWTLPLCAEMHRKQHSMNELAFWAGHGINPHHACLVLWGIYSDYGSEGLDRASGLIRSGALRNASINRETGKAIR